MAFSTSSQPEALPIASPAPVTAYQEPRRTIRGDLREIITEVWGARELLWQLALKDIRIRYKQAIMGFAWALFMPVLIVLAGFAVRIAMAFVSGQPLGGRPVAGMALKAIPWAFFAGAISFAVTSLTANFSLVSKVYFPREVLPLAALVAQCFDTFIGAVAVVVALPFLDVHFHWTALWALPLVVLLVLFTSGVALFLSCANLFFRDVKYIVQVLITFGIFFTPVFFEPAMFGPKWGPLAMLNPLSPILEGLRLAVVEGHNLATPLLGTAGHFVWRPWYLGYATGITLLVLLVSSLLFHRSANRFAEFI